MLGRMSRIPVGEGDGEGDVERLGEGVGDAPVALGDGETWVGDEGLATTVE
jgi:hypothetical protein